MSHWFNAASEAAIDDSAKGGLTQFWELFTMIPCAQKFKTLITSLCEDILVSD